ncbi:MAG: hypothetical protein ACKVQT_37200 [Burkholderiales bacterium]
MSYSILKPAMPSFYPAARRWQPAVVAAGVFLLAGGLAVSCGMVLALGSKQLTLLLFGLVGGSVLLFAPVFMTLSALIVLSYLIVGQLTYFAKLTQALWIPTLIAGILYLRVPIERGYLAVAERKSGIKRSMPPFQFALMAFFALAAASAALNASPVMQVLVGAKMYLFIWSVVLLIGLGTISEGRLELIWRATLALLVVQLPFVFYQHFFVASNRSQTPGGGMSWDAVVGSFGGDPEGGGGSGALALFVVVTFVLIGALWRRQLIHRGLAIVLNAIGLAVIVLAEIKVVFILLPIGLMLLAGRDALRYPVRALFGLLAMIIVLAGALFAYQELYWKDGNQRQDGIEGAIEETIQFNFGEYTLGPGRGEMGRFAALAHWWRESARWDTAKILVGHGPAATRISQTIGLGEMARKYPVRLDFYGLTVLLWELGVLGAAAFVAILLVGAANAAGLARRPTVPVFHRAVLEAASVALVLIAICLLYNKDALDSPPVQLLMALLLGQVAYWHWKRVPSQGDHRHAPIVHA